MRSPDIIREEKVRPEILNSLHVTKDMIKEGLRKLGLRKGDLLLIHSSLKSMGYVIGGPDTVIDAVMEVVGDSGLLMLPTFTFTNFQPFFDPETTPSQMGLITETLRRREDSLRSIHPRHSVGVLGNRAEEFIRGHLQAGSLGKGSPLDKLAKEGGYILLLGVGHNVNSILHTAEVYAEVPYLYSRETPDFPDEAFVKLNGSKIKVDLAPSPGCSEGFWKIEPLLRRKRIIKDGNIGQAKCQMMKAQEVLDAATLLLKDNPRALLCDEPKCYSCNEKRKAIRSSLVLQD